MKRFFFTGSTLLALACGVRADSVRYLNGEVAEGKVELGAKGVTVATKGGAPAPVDLANIFKVSFRRNQHSPDLLLPGVVFVNGTAIAEKGAISAVGAPTITVGDEKITVPINAVAWVLFAPLPREKLSGAPAGQTGGLMPNGDFFPGTFVGTDKGRIIINSALFGPQKLEPKDHILGLVLRELKAAPTRFEVVTVQGSKFLTDEVQFENGAMVVKDSVAGPVRIKAENVVELRAGSGRFQPLVDQKPASVNAPVGTDAAAAVSVRKAGEDSTEGAPSVLTTAGNAAINYSVPAGFSVFTSGMAVPANAPAGARMAFAVYADGRPIFRSPAIGTAEKPTPIKINIGAARTVTLRVEPAGLGGGMFGEWLDPMLLR